MNLIQKFQVNFRAEKGGHGLGFGHGLGQNLDYGPGHGQRHDFGLGHGFGLGQLSDTRVRPSLSNKILLTNLQNLVTDIFELNLQN